MRSTFKVLFYLKKNNVKPNGKVPIMGRITVNGTIAQFSCKLNVRPSLWDTKANKAEGKSIEAQKINEKLENIKTQIGKQYQTISNKDAFVSAEKVKNAYLGFGDEYRTLFSIADEFYEAYKKRVGKDRTAGSYEQLLINRRRIELFLKDKYSLSDMTVHWYRSGKHYYLKSSVWIWWSRWLSGSILPPPPGSGNTLSKKQPPEPIYRYLSVTTPV